MQIAKFFASLGFKVDMTGLNEFENKLKDVRKSSALFARNLKVLANRLEDVKTKVNNINGKLDLTSQKKGTGGVADAYNKLGDSLLKATHYLDKFASESEKANPKITILTGKTWSGKTAWDAYARAVKEAKDNLSSVNSQLATLRGSPPKINVRVNQTVSGGGGGQRPLAPIMPHQPSMVENGSTMLLGGLPRFLRAFTPTGVMAGGALGAGFSAKEVIQAGREMQKMDQMLLQASANTETFQHNLQFTKKSADELAVSVLEFGNAYAKLLNATERTPLSLKETQDIVYNFSKYMRAVNMSEDDQKGFFRQLGQMFMTGRIQQDELNSMADRGVNMNKFILMSAERLGISAEAYLKLQEAGKADPVKFMRLAAKFAGEAAEKNGAFAKSLDTSLAAQQRFTNKMRSTAQAILEAGLDKLLKNLFDILSDLMDLLKPVAIGFTQIASGIVDLTKVIGGVIKSVATFSGENKLLAAGIGVIIGLLITKRMALLRNVTMLSQLAFAGTKAIMALRTVLGATGLLGALWAIYEFGTAYADHLKGDTNWVSMLIAQVEALIATFDFMFSLVERGFIKMKNMSLEDWGDKAKDMFNKASIVTSMLAPNIFRLPSGDGTAPFRPDTTPNGGGGGSGMNSLQPLSLTGRLTLFDQSGKPVGEIRPSGINYGALGQ